MTRYEYRKALLALENYINHGALGVRYMTSLNAPNTYKKMISHRNEHGHFLVFSGKSDTTIFSSQELNIKFRALHDKMHYDLGLTFSFKDEKKLSTLTGLSVFNWLKKQGYSLEIAYHALKIVNAEIAGQIEYYERRGKFLENQREYIETYLQVAA